VVPNHEIYTVICRLLTRRTSSLSDNVECHSKKGASDSKNNGTLYYRQLLMAIRTPHAQHVRHHSHVGDVTAALYEDPTRKIGLETGSSFSAIYVFIDEACCSADIDVVMTQTPDWLLELLGP